MLTKRKGCLPIHCACCVPSNDVFLACHPYLKGAVYLLQVLRYLNLSEANYCKLSRGNTHSTEGEAAVKAAACTREEASAEAAESFKSFKLPFKAPEGVNITE